MSVDTPYDLHLQAAIDYDYISQVEAQLYIQIRDGAPAHEYLDTYRKVLRARQRAKTINYVDPYPGVKGTRCDT